MVNGILGSNKGRLICLGVLAWAAIAIMFMTSNATVFFSGFTLGIADVGSINTENYKNNQPINGYIHNVLADASEYYTDYFQSMNDISLTSNNTIYVVPADDKNNCFFLTVKKDSSTDVQLKALMKAVQNDEKDSEIIKKGVWIDAVGLIPVGRIADIAQDPINEHRDDPISIYHYVIDCSHPYSGFLFRFCFGAVLLLSLIITVAVLIKRVKAIVIADEITVRESYIAANRTPPEKKPKPDTSFNPNIRLDSYSGESESNEIFDSSKRNTDFYGSGSVTYGKFQSQGGQSEDGFFGE